MCRHLHRLRRLIDGQPHRRLPASLPPRCVGARGRIAGAFRSRGPWLGVGLFCPVASSLTMASSELLAGSRCVIAFRYRVFALRRPARRSLLLSANPSIRAVSHTPADRTAQDDCTSARNSLRPNARGSASAKSHLNRNTWVPFRGCEVRLMLRPEQLLALLRQGLLHSSFHSMSHLIRTSNISTRANRQFPRPDLHRLDSRPYRLHHIPGIGLCWHGGRTHNDDISKGKALDSDFFRASPRNR